MAVDLLVTGGQLVSPREVFPGAVAIDKGKIVAVGDLDHFPEARRRIDVTGKYVLPGLVDPHIHYHYSERPFGDDARTETQASVAGGVTTQGIYIGLEELPWDTYFLPRSLQPSQASAPARPGPKPMDFEDYKSAFERNAVADGFFHVQTSKALTQQQADKLLEFGITSFKLYPAKAGLNDADILATFRVIQGLRPPALAMMHCENGTICELLTDEVMKTGRTDHRAYNDARPRFAEVEFMSRALYLAQAANCPLYIVHITVGEGPELLAWAKARGVKVMGETCPQYLTHSSEDAAPLLQANPVLTKVNPPLRDRKPWIVEVG